MADQTRNQRTSNEQSRNGDTDRGLSRWNDPRGLSRYEKVWSPFEMMRRFSEDVDRLFGSMGPGATSSQGWPMESGRSLGQREGTGKGSSNALTTWMPSVDVATRGDDLVVMAELPGIKPEDVQIEVEDNNLIIKGESRNEQENNSQGYWYSERRYGSFYRTIPLPKGIRTENAQAQFNNGVLEITLPGAIRAASPQRQRIEISGTKQQGQQNQQIGTGTGTGTVTGNGNGRSTKNGQPTQEKEKAATK